MNNSRFTASNAEAGADGAAPLTAQDHRAMLLSLLGLTESATDKQVRLAHKGAMVSIEASADQKATAKNCADLSTPAARRLAFDAFIEPLTFPESKGGKAIPFEAAMAMMRTDPRGRAILTAMDQA